MTKKLTINDWMRMDIEKLKEKERKALEALAKKIDAFAESLESFENMKNKVQEKLYYFPGLSSEEREWLLEKLHDAESLLKYRIYSLINACASKLISKHEKEIDN